MRKLSVLLCLTFAVLSLQAQLLWKVTGGGAQSPSWLFGTHHVAPSTFIDSVAGLNEAINRAEQLYVEIENDSLADDAAQERITRRCIAPADSTIDKLLNSEEYDIVDKVLSDYMGVPGALSMLNTLKPVALSVELQAMESAKYFPESEDAQIDAAVQVRAISLGKPVYSLETVDGQLDLLFNVPLKEQAEDLVEVCRVDSLFFDYNRQLAEAYQAQNLDYLWELMNDDELGSNDEQTERLIYSRNRVWAARLFSEMRRRSTLVCVGAGHLPGEQGLISLLRELGFTVEPVIQ